MPYSWQNRLKISIFGRSHEKEIGVELSGIPAGESIDLAELRAFLRRRAPGQSEYATARCEADEPIFSSGLSDGVTDGGRIRAVIENKDVKSQDYVNLIDCPRPGHADYTAWLKYGGREDMRGGGAFSGRMTAPLCVAGGICLQILRRRGVKISAHILKIGDIYDKPYDPMLGAAECCPDFPCASPDAAQKMQSAIRAAATSGDSLGAVIECAANGVPTGLGGALFDGLEGRIASIVFAVPAVKGIEFGAGFGVSELRGSENNDAYIIKEGRISLATNNAGGILGGISDGMPLIFRAAVKPTPSIAKTQRSVSLSEMTERELNVSGRHDPCIAPRAVPVIEAAAAIALLDAVLEDSDE